VATYERVLRERGGTAAFLVWGDPSLYDSTIRVVDRIAKRMPLAYDVLPGISAPQLLAARHRIVLHPVGHPVHITTGRRLSADAAAGLDDTVVVMLDGDLACRSIDDPRVEIFWGANIGTAEEVLRSGRLADVIDDIARVRADVRSRVGWVMDTYVLRRAKD